MRLPLERIDYLVKSETLAPRSRVDRRGEEGLGLGFLDRRGKEGLVLGFTRSEESGDRREGEGLARSSLWNFSFGGIGRLAEDEGDGPRRDENDRFKSGLWFATVRLGPVIVLKSLLAKGLRTSGEIYYYIFIYYIYSSAFMSTVFFFLLIKFRPLDLSF